MLTCESLLFFMRGRAAASEPPAGMGKLCQTGKSATEEEGSCVGHENFDRGEKTPSAAFESVFLFE
jgi:hypothetical protein